MKDYNKPKSFSNSTLNNTKPVSVGMALAKGLARGLRGGVYISRDIISGLSPVKKSVAN